MTITREQVIDHAMWLHGKGGKRLEVDELEDYVFREDNLMGASFSEGTFTNCYFVAGGFRASSFYGAEFRECVFTGDIEITGADFTYSKFYDCRIDSVLLSKLKKAELFSACEFY
jgi:uncharacterized protein YjbI with pentapeptide repeats